MSRSTRKGGGSGTGPSEGLVSESLGNLGITSTNDEADDAHAALGAGYRDWAGTRRANGPSRFGGFGVLPPWPRNMQWARGQPSDGISPQDNRMRLFLCTTPLGTPITLLGGGGGSDSGGPRIAMASFIPHPHAC